MSLVKAYAILILLSWVSGQSKSEDRMVLSLAHSIFFVGELSKLKFFKFNDEIKPCNFSVEDACKR